MAEHSKILRKTEEARLNQLYQTKCNEVWFLIIMISLFSKVLWTLSSSFCLSSSETWFRTQMAWRSSTLLSRRQVAARPLSTWTTQSSNTRFSSSLRPSSGKRRHPWKRCSHKCSPIKSWQVTADVSDKVVNEVTIVVGGRVPKIDKVTEDILSEEAMIVYLNYID